MDPYDYHVHSQYSDGAELGDMVAAAADAGLAGVGFADHCNLTSERKREEWGFVLDEVYEERRAELRAVRTEVDIEVFDAVEMDYDPTAESEIRAFLDEAAFDYAIGSVHYLDGVHTSKRGAFADRDDVCELLDEYYDELVALIESDLFDIVAHVDVFRRNPELRGYDEGAQYERVAAALADSRTIPEINAGRVDRTYGTVHPAPEFFQALAEYDVSFTLGTDAHRPDEMEPRVDHLRRFVTENAVDPVTIHS